MRRHWPIALLVLAAAGCGAGRHDELAREQTELNEELAREWAGVTDAASMKAAEPKLVEHYRRLVRLNREAKKLGKPSDAVNEVLGTKYAARMQAAVNQILREQQRIHDDVPGGVAFLQKIERGFKKPRDGSNAAPETTSGTAP